MHAKSQTVSLVFTPVFLSCRSNSASLGVWNWTTATQSAHDGRHWPHETPLLHQRCASCPPTHLRSAGHQHAPSAKSKLLQLPCANTTSPHSPANLAITSTTCQTCAPPPTWPHPPCSFLITQSFYFSSVYNFQGSEPTTMASKFSSKFSVTKSVWVGCRAGSGAADSGAGLYFHTPFMTDHSCEMALLHTKWSRPAQLS